jgi:hypothetical protein
MVAMGDFVAVNWVVAGASALVLLGLTASKSISKPKRVYPPGPPRNPIWSNLFNFPLVRWHETFTEWQKSWGTL